MEKFRVTEDLISSQGQRFLNYIIDLVVQYLLGACIGIVAVLIFQLFDSYWISDYFETMNKLEEYVFGILISLIYYIIMESFFSRTIAKYITGTIVVMKDGSKPDSQTILKRTLCRLIPFDGLSFFGTPSRGWHDSMSNTFVVNKADFDRKKELFYDFEQIGKEIEE